MKNRLFFLFVSLSALLLLQRCDLERIEPGSGNATKFQTTIGGNADDFPTDMLVTSDGSYVVVGYTQSFTADNNNQAYIVKLDSTGNQLWEKNFGGAKNDYAQSVISTSDGGYIFCGKSESFNPDFIEYVYLVKVTAEGSLSWEKNYGNDLQSQNAFGIVPVGNNEFLVGYQMFDGLINHVKLMRINSNGAKVDAEDKMVLTGDIFIKKMIKTSDGKIVMVGTRNNLLGSVAYTAKLDEDGDLIWDKTYPEQATNQNSTLGLGMVEMSDKSLMIAGSYLGSNDHDFNVIQYNEIGGRIYNKTWGGANDEELLDITRTLDGEVVVMGYSGSFSVKNEIYLSKRKASDGSQIWEKHFLETWVLGADVEATPDGGYVICTGENAANADIIIVKTDANGNYQ